MARHLVRHVSHAIDNAYTSNVLEMKGAERYWVRVWQRRERWAFPLARLLDREAMATQMVEEGWWG